MYSYMYNIMYMYMYSCRSKSPHNGHVNYVAVCKHVIHRVQKLEDTFLHITKA